MSPGLALAAVLVFAASSEAAAPYFHSERLFEGGTQGYNIYRIPGIVVTKKGSILAYTEARRTNGNDWDSIDIVMRRSSDGGATFSPQRVIAHVPGKIQRNPVAAERNQGKPGDITYNNPVAIADADGSVHFLFCLEYMRAFRMRSDDDGLTFSAPIEITSAFDAFRSDYAWRIIAVGPGHGIQLKRGRLLASVWLSLGTAGNGHHPSVTATIYSDDHGATWHRGAIAVPSSAEFPDPNEATLAELPSGFVMLNVRTEAKENRRVVLTSKDGATAWSAPHLQQDLPEPVCFGSLMRFKKDLLFVNPDNLLRADGKDIRSKDRVNLKVRLSHDNGMHWTASRTIERAATGYSDLSVAKNGSILCLYEAVPKIDGVAHHDELLARFNLEWLTQGNEARQ
jgi:sialidase-1